MFIRPITIRPVMIPPSFLSLLIVTLLMSVYPSLASATPDQLWEDFIFTEQPREWVERLPEGSPDRIFFEILNAQTEGELDYASQRLESVKDQPRLTRLLAKLKARQTLLEITHERSKESWQSLLDLTNYPTPASAYLPPRQKQAQTHSKEATAHQLSDRELNNKVNLQETASGELTQRGLQRSLLEDLHSLSEQNKQSDEIQRKRLSRLKALKTLPIKGAVPLMMSLTPRYWRQLEWLDQLSDQQTLQLLSVPSLSEETQKRLVDHLLNMITESRRLNDPIVNLTVAEWDQYLEALSSLAPSLGHRANTLHAHLALAKLARAERTGEWPLDTLLTYLALPMDPRPLENVYRRSLGLTPPPSQKIYPTTQWVHKDQLDLFATQTGLSLKEEPSELVARHIEYHLKSHPNLTTFSPYVDQTLLKKMWAKAHLTSGGSPSNQELKDYLESEDYEALVKLKTLSFSPYTLDRYRRDQAVELPLWVKGYKELQVRVYTLNMSALHDRYQNVPLNLDLSGMRANIHREINLIDDPLLIQRRSLKLPELSSAGSYIIDIQAGEAKIRSIIHKGTLTPYVDESASGLSVYIIDELGRQVSDAQVSLQDRVYNADDRGRYLIPYSATQEDQMIKITQGDLCVKQQINIPRERYSLSLHVATPQLRGGGSNQAHIRAQLMLNGEQLPISLLRNASLSLRVEGRDGTPQLRTVDRPQFDGSGELTLPITLPLGFQSVSFQLSGKIKPTSAEEMITLNSGQVSGEYNTDLNSINIGDLYFLRSKGGSTLKVIGRNGEPISDVSLSIALHHKLLLNPLTFNKRSDQNGEVSLPRDLSMINIVEAIAIFANSDRARRHRWLLFDHHTSQPSRLTIAEGISRDFPWSGSDQTYLIKRSNRRVLNDKLTINQGVAHLKPLSAGHYLLVDPDRHAYTPLTVFDSKVTLRDGLLSSTTGVTKHSPPSHLHIESVGIEQGAFTVNLKGVTPHARLHLVATPYALQTPLFKTFNDQRPLPKPSIKTNLSVSQYGSGGRISEELRYILRRQQSGGHTGVLAPSPSLLINRDDRGTATSIDQLMFGGLGASGGGYGFGKRGASKSNRRGRRRSINPFSPEAARGQLIDDSWRSWDFLKRGALVKWAIDISEADNSQGDQRLIQLPLSQLNGLGRVHLVLTDGHNSHARSVILPTEIKAEINAETLATRSLRAPPLKSGSKVTIIQRAQRVVKGEETLTLPSVNSLWKSYHSLESAYQLYARLLPSAKMHRLHELLTWPQLSDDERWALYDRVGSHEVDLFIYHKDPQFFKTYIAPLIAQKGNLSFLERWMIGAPIDVYLSPSRFESLNLFERILLLKRVKRLQRPDGQSTAEAYVKALLSHRPVAKSKLRALFQSALAPGLEDKKDQGTRHSLSKMKRSKRHSLAPELNSPLAPPPAPVPSSEPMEDEEVKSLERKRAQAPRLYKTEGATHLWSERRYHDRYTPDATLISVNQFWLDYAAHDPNDGPFLSAHFPEAATLFSAAWIALALLDLPFKAEKPTFDTREGEIKLAAKSHGLYFYEGAKSVTSPEKQRLTIQTEHCTVNLQGLVPDKCDHKALRAGVPLLTQVIVLNPSSKAVNFELNNPLPEGAIGLLGSNGGSVKTSVDVALRPRGVTSFEYYYYFPTIGTFTQGASYAIKEDKLIAVSSPNVLEVVKELSELNTESWREVARLGDDQEVFAYLERHHPREVDLSLIYNRLPRRGFYQRLIKSLSTQQVFIEKVWRYAIHHQDQERLAEAISLTPHLMSHLSPYFGTTSDTIPLKYDEYERLNAQHLDFDPLTVARAHARGKVDHITHPKLREEYLQRLKYLAHKPRDRWSSYDLLAVCYFLVKQGRLGDAEQVFNRVGAPSSELSEPHFNLFYDYLKSYLALSRGEVESALTLARSHIDVKHQAWRKRFRDLITPPQLAALEVEAERGERQTPNVLPVGRSLNVELNAEMLKISALNLKRAEINLYPMNLEILFSVQPSSLEGSLAQRPLVKASYSEEIKLNHNGETTYQLPAEWRDQALMIEVTSEGQRHLHTYSPQHFTPHLFPQQGLLRVLTPEPKAQPLAGVYVKVFAKLKSGEVRFYKDGYTDFRGLLDYVNANPAPNLSSIKQFSLLIIVEGRGATTRTVIPPAH